MKGTIYFFILFGIWGVIYMSGYIHMVCKKSNRFLEN